MAGILLSTLCLIHCSVVPIALPLLQAAGLHVRLAGLLEDEAIHLIFAYLLLGIGGVAFISGYFRHRALLPLFAGALGTALLYLGALNPQDRLSERGTEMVTIAATFTLIYAHIKNRRAHCAPRS